MAAYLKNLKVKKVSFVQSPANLKPFVLTKAIDSASTGTSATADDGGTLHIDPQDGSTFWASKDIDVNVNSKLNKKEGDVFIMNEELKKKIQELLKKGISRDAVIQELKKTEEVPEELEKTIQFFLDLVETKTVEKTVEVEVEKKVVDEKAMEVVKDLKEKLASLEKERALDRIVTWLEKECSSYPGNVKETAEKIYKLQSVDEEAAQVMKDAIKTASDTVEKSVLFEDRGSVALDADELGALVKTVSTELEKSKDKNDKDITAIIDKAVADHPQAYREYLNNMYSRMRKA